MVCDLREPRRLRSRFSGIWKVRIICIIFKLKGVFSAPLLTTYTPNNLHSITCHEHNVQSPIRTYPIITLHEKLGNFSACLNCIPPIKFHLSKLQSNWFEQLIVIRYWISCSPLAITVNVLHIIALHHNRDHQHFIPFPLLINTLQFNVLISFAFWIPWNILGFISTVV